MRFEHAPCNRPNANSAHIDLSLNQNPSDAGNFEVTANYKASKGLGIVLVSSYFNFV